jgi:hypothetical protein
VCKALKIKQISGFRNSTFTGGLRKNVQEHEDRDENR